ncbi:MAG: hypothetical protein FJ387_09655 [Verrucomicrobia bacterium]|nr:hypothetical protein [Verrucomicrobiota bacterium]
MDAAPIQRHVRAADLPLDRLATSSAVPHAQKVQELSRQFEAVLLRQVLRDSQKTLFPSEWTSPSTAKDIYQDMIADQLAEAISHAGSFGVARNLGRQLTRQLAPAPGPATATTPPSHD